VAGIAKAYEPEKMVGRKVVIVANLQPAQAARHRVERHDRRRFARRRQAGPGWASSKTFRSGNGLTASLQSLVF
jgi:hypothetical protein